MSAYITTADGAQKRVANLGWLLRNWKLVESIEAADVDRRHARYSAESPLVCVMPDVAPQRRDVPCGHAAALMIVRLRGGGFYACYWADTSVLLAWLTRPTMRGLPLIWFGLQSECGQAERARS